MDMNAIESFWADDYFGCSLSDIQSEKDIVCSHRYLKGYNGLFIMKIRNKFMVSAPPERISELRQIANRRFDLFDLAVIQEHITCGVERYIGPCWIGYPEGKNHTTHSNTVGIITQSDALYPKILGDFKCCCDEIEWSHSGINGESQFIAVQNHDHQIVAAASYELWGSRVAHIGIITHPQYRNKGFATNVLSSLTEFVISQGLIPQYRTLCSNAPAIKVAQNYGYKEYATHISIRLK